jgi:hypothetical protein
MMGDKAAMMWRQLGPGFFRQLAITSASLLKSVERMYRRAVDFAQTDSKQNSFTILCEREILPKCIQ